MSLPAIILLVSALLVLVSVVQRVAARWTLPAAILLAVMGAVIGSVATWALWTGAGGVIGDIARGLVDIPVTSDTFMYVFVPALLFQSSLSVDVKRLVEDAAPIFLLAVVAVLVATAVIGVAVAPIAGVSLVACLLLASVVATTDSVAVISIFRDVGAPTRLCRLVEGESLLNDAAAIVAFSVLLGMLLGDQAATVAGAAWAFMRTFVGGIVVGYAGARVVVAAVPWLQDLRLAQVTLTLALPYFVFIVGERTLGVSGVIAAVTAGLVMGASGQPRIAPADWKFLIDMWEQLAYWASSLIFVLASILVPRLLVDVGWFDLVVLGAILTAALVARALILFGMFPLLTAAGLSQRIGHRYNVVILWGGLRGAVTLALALAVTENSRVPYDVQRFVGVQATGFVLFSMLVHGMTLRPLISWLGLNRLSAFDQALRTQVITLSRQRVADAVERIGRQYRTSESLIAEVADNYRTPAPSQAASSMTSPGEAEQIRLGLVALTQHEREIVLEHFDARTVSGRTVEELLTDVGLLLERARSRGLTGYRDAGHQIVGFGVRFRLAHLLHRKAGIAGPLVDRLADRFEHLLVSRIVLEELAPYSDTLTGLVSPGTLERLRGVIAERQQMTSAALEALGAQYPDYAALLERRFLRRLALRREGLEYRTLLDARVIGPELHGTLQRELEGARAAAHERPRLDLGLEARSLIARVPMFASLARTELDILARLLQPQLAIPEERIITTGEPGTAMYFIASGVVDVRVADRQILLTRDDFFGEMALVHDQPRQGDVTARSYCLLLVLARRDFDGVVRRNGAIRERIDREAHARARMNRAASED